jgi:acyl-CoA synthetase (AMP-forming)/AMP-acid ligase II
MKLLPIYMIPDDFIFVNSLPITSSNKIDYQKLINQTV